MVLFNVCELLKGCLFLAYKLKSIHMRSFLFVFVLVLGFGRCYAQKTSIKLSDLQSFSPVGISGFQSMADGLHYTLISDNGKAIDKYEFATGKKVGELVNLDKIENSSVIKIDGYELNSTESKVLFYTNSVRVYRHSTLADYFVYDIKYKELIALSDSGKVQMATFSPNGDMVAFAKDNNLFVNKLRFKTTSQITTDGEFNKVLNGIPDWVYEEEFSMSRAFEWSPDSKEIAYIRFDEQLVREFSFQLYEASFPTMNENALYPNYYKYKYPKAGEANSLVSVKVFNIENRTTKTMDCGKEADIYIPRIKWTALAGELSVVRLNRLQNQLDLLIINSASSVGNTVLTDRNEKYIGEEALDGYEFLPDGKHFVYMGELDGYNHLYLYSMAGKKLALLTDGNYDVTDYYGFDSDRNVFYYQAAEESPMNREVYQVSMDGKSRKKISSLSGVNSAEFSSGFKYQIISNTSVNEPNVVILYDQKGKNIRVLEDNKSITHLAKDYVIAQKEFIEIPLQNGIQLNASIMKPANFNASEKYPVLIMQYSGPNSQQVLNKWSIGWEQVLISKGYVVVTVDPRGTAARGEDFRKCTYLNLGKTESDDVIESAKYLSSLAFVDVSRIGIFGWSYGGFMTLLSMSKSDVFKAGVAIAPVTSWRFYDSVYTERYMKRPFENAKGYDENSPLMLTDNLSGRLLLVHGTADDNVHFQNSAEYIDNLVQANKQFDLFVYPNRNHNIMGGNTRNHLYQMIIAYLEKNL